jgi:hypothetical protein
MFRKSLSSNYRLLSSLEPNHADLNYSVSFLTISFGFDIDEFVLVLSEPLVITM